jgi:hypothetical protein
MISLAPLYYRNAVDKTHGPIMKVEVAPRISKRLGKQSHALGYLHHRILNPDRPNKYVIYGNSGASGTGRSVSEATHKVISEGLERWAHIDSFNHDPFNISLGFDLDASTSGFAAWPGTSSRIARRKAQFEAMERWALQAWWLERIGHTTLSHSYTDIEAIQLSTPWQDAAVVIVSSCSEAGNFCYGFAADETAESALHRAIIELERNERVLDQWSAFSHRPEPTLLQEKRLVYFASKAGNEIFKERIGASPSSASLRAPVLATDQRVAGSWDKFCRVWRCVFEPVAPLDNVSQHVFMF